MRPIREVIHRILARPLGHPKDGPRPARQLRRLVCETLEDRHLLSGVTLITHVGTAGDDAFALTVGNVYTVVLNGVETQYDAGEVTTILFEGAEGSDTATITGSDGDETFELRAGEAVSVGSGIELQLSNVEKVVVEGGGGNDTVNFYDSPNNDRFVAAPMYGRLVGDGFSMQAIAFREVNAYATGGGHDVARIYDSPGDDIFHSTPMETTLYPEDGADPFFIRARHFEEAHGFSPAGGHDSAFFFDSDGDDTFTARPGEGAMAGPTGGGPLGDRGYFNRVKLFEEIRGDASAGGNDRADLMDSDEADLLEATSNWARLSNASGDFLCEVLAFDQVNATATSAGDTKDVNEPLDFLLTLQGDWGEADQPPYEAFFDFGTASSPLSPGFVRVDNATQYTAAQGYGWLSGVVSSRDRGGSGLLERDLNYTRDATFVVDIPNGEYWIDIILGDVASYAHDLMGVYFEGTQVASVSTAGGQLVNKRFDVNVADGQLTLRLMDLGGGDVNVVIEGLRILAAGTDNPVSNAWWPAREGIPKALFSARTQSGVYDYYLVETAYQRSGTNIRVLLPDDYDPQQEYPVIYVLPVEKGDGRQFGDGMTSIYNHGLHRTTDAIFVQPTFSDTPWFADNISNSTIWQETYFRDVIVPFIEEQYPVIDGPDGRLLLGYSKSGYGAVSMLLRNQDYFGRAVAWDAPLAMSDPATGWDFVSVLGSTSNFHNNYRITNLLQDEGLGLIGQPPRIFLQGYSYDFTRADHAAIHAQMTSLGIPHTYDPGVYRSHLWASGWMPGAVAALMAGV